MELICFMILAWDALPKATTDTTEAMPMIIPSMVSKDRILFAKIE